MFIEDLIYSGALLWYIFSELFMSSPNKVYADALKKVKINEEVKSI